MNKKWLSFPASEIVQYLDFCYTNTTPLVRNGAQKNSCATYLDLKADTAQSVTFQGRLVLLLTIHKIGRTKCIQNSTVENKSSIQIQTAPWSEKSRVQVTSNKANNEIVNLINKSTDYSTHIVLQAKIQIDSPICKLARAPYKEKSLVCHDE